MKFFLFLVALSLISFSPVFAEQVIFSEGTKYEIAEITKEYTLNRHSQIFKTEGFTTTGEIFFLRESPNFDKVMLLDTSGQWHKAEMKEEIVEEIIPTNPVIVEEGIELHYILDQYERVYNKADYKFFVKTFDKSIYSGNNYDNFEGNISGAKVTAIIADPNGEIKADLEGFAENGIYEGSIQVPENLWQRGWYSVDLVIEFEGKFYHEQLSFYVYGEVVPSGSSSCPIGQTKINGVCT